MRPATTVPLFALALLFAAPSLAMADCPRNSDPAAKLTFDDSDHRHWYARFWNGKCEGLSFFQTFVCFSGKPFWYDTLDSSLGRVEAPRRDAICTRLWELGRVIGHEWARSNDVRRIDTDTLQVWYRVFEGTPDVSAAIDKVGREAAQKLAK